jgi:hypothetical protein
VGTQRNDQTIEIASSRIELGIVAGIDREGFVGSFLNRGLEEGPFFGRSQIEGLSRLGNEPGPIDNREEAEAPQ